MPLSSCFAFKLIDFSHFRHGTAEEKRACAKAIVSGFKDAGFIYLKNHGVPEETVKDLFQKVLLLFALKLKYYNKLFPATNHTTAYSPQSSSNVHNPRKNPSHGTAQEQIEATALSVVRKPLALPLNRTSIPYGKNPPTSRNPSRLGAPMNRNILIYGRTSLTLLAPSSRRKWKPFFRLGTQCMSKSCGQLR